MRSLLTLLFLTLVGTCARAQNAPAPSPFPTPVNDLTAERADARRPPLPQPPPRAADIVWQERTWREIDVREKMNLPFAHPERPLVSILLEAAERGEIQLYGTIDDRFTTPLTAAELTAIKGRNDTVPVVDPQTQQVRYEVVARDFDPRRVTRYRLQELWYTDRNSSRMQVRILGLAPIVEERDENGNYQYTAPLFWTYLPAARPVLAREAAFVNSNERAGVSWDDVFLLRRFASKVTKQGNVLNRRIEDYVPAGRDRLLVAERKERERLGRESDLWEW